MTRSKLLVPGTLGPLAAAAADLLAARGYEPVVLGEVDDTDIDAGLAHVDNDVCTSTIAVVGQYMRWLAAHGAHDVRVLAPELCHECRSASLGAVLAAALGRAGYTDVEVVAFTSADVAVCCPADAGVPSGDAPLVGICGNVPVLSTWQFHRTVTEHLHAAGCATVAPPLSALVHSADFLTPAVQWFSEHGVRTVICILPFGCLGGHVYARGQLRKLQREYPDVQITMLDYDPSASDVNLVNRTELVIQSAREK